MKEISSNQPLVTIVTAVLNDVSGIEATIRSVIGQSYRRFEYLIIDGGSTDGTLAVIEAYADKIDYWVSEPDEGIYHAFNKGIEVAQGEWIAFMNSSDCFSSDDVLEQVFRFNKLDGFAVLYGNHNVIHSRSPWRLRSYQGGAVKNLWRGSQFCHQAAFVRVAQLRDNPFKTAFNICADFDFFYSTWRSGAKFCYLDITICNILPGGISDTRRLTSIMEMWSIVDRNLLINIYFSVKVCRVAATCVTLNLLPSPIGARLKSFLKSASHVKDLR